MPMPSEPLLKRMASPAEVLTEDRLDEIALLAEAVADEHCPKGRVEPELIAGRNRITLSFSAYDDAFDGMLEHRSGRFHIYANQTRLRTRDGGRARFTVAHELGHFYIDEHRRALASGAVPRHPSFCDHQSKNPVEQEADHFASHLLMPTDRFRQSAKGLPMGLDAVLSLKDTFGTSITSTAIRYTKLNVAPCTLVKWDRDGFSWKWFASDTYSAGYRKTIEEQSRVPKDSPTGRALAGEAPPSKGYFHAGTSASAWFPGAWAGTAKDVLLIEQAIGLGEFGTLTMLFPEARRFN